MKLKDLIKSKHSIIEKMLLAVYSVKNYKKIYPEKYYSLLTKYEEDMGKINHEEIMAKLKEHNINIQETEINKNEFLSFSSDFEDLCKNYQNPDIICEKKLEHYCAFKLLGLDKYNSDDIYVDVAACDSSFAKDLREKYNLKTYAIDLDKSAKFANLDYYLVQDASKTLFQDNSIKGMSLQCAFEMFRGDDDINLIKEAARILKKGGKMVIAPLYMHQKFTNRLSANIYEKQKNRQKC